MKIGLFFGSFNPPHIGHLIIANSIVELSDLDKIQFVVTPQNPFKKLKSLAHEFDRYDMVNAAIGENDLLEVTDLEFSLPKPNYTVHTLAYLQEKYPNYDFALIIGEDNLSNFHRWKNSDYILENYDIYVYPRPNSKPSDLREHPHVKILDLPMIDISATFIRDSLRNERSIRYLVPTAVEEIIAKRKLYI